MSDNSGQLNLSDGKNQPLRSDSVVRDHLANERTFLAWQRTAMALMGFGVLIARLQWMSPASPVHRGVISSLGLGIALSCIGLAMIPFSLWHYFATRRALDDNKYRAIGVSAIVFAVAMGIAGVGIIIYLCTSLPGVATASGLP